MWKADDFKPAPLGTHIARCVRVIDIGTQVGEYQGKPTSRRQCIITWELPTELMDDGRPFTVSRYYTTSLSEKSNLRADLAAWRGRDFSPEELNGFDEKNLLGKGCMVNITEKSGKHRVTGVVAAPRNVPLPPQVNPSVHFSLERGEFNEEILRSLGDRLQETIRKSPEFRALVTGGSDADAKTDDFVDDIPF